MVPGVSPNLLRSAFLFVGSQAAWFACVLGAAAGRPWVGVIATAAWIAAWGASRGRWKHDMGFLAAVAAVGFLVDSGLVSLGVFGFPDAAHLGGPSPLWMVALWVGFGTTMPMLAPRLRPLPIASALGAVAGPVAYNGGVVMGAAHFGADAWTSRLVVGVAWACVMPALVWLHGRIGEAGEPIG